MNRKLSAVVSAITPFDHDGRVDEALLRAQFRRFAASGLTVNVAGSGSGEGFTLSAEERDRILEIAVEELRGKVPVRAMGCEPRTAAEMIEFLRAAERAGVDSAQIFSLDIGNALAPSPAEMRHYYQSAIESTTLPVHLSSHVTAGYLLPLDLIEELVKRYPGIAGMSYGGTDAVYLAALLARVGDRVEVHCAGPGQALTTLGLGGHGFMGGEGNFAPEAVAAVIERFAAADLAGLREAYARLMALHALIHRIGGGSMRGVKPLMNAFGLPGGELRPPRLAIGEAELAGAVKAVAGLNLPGIKGPL